MASSSRSWLIDVLKALASQLIVLHHLCLYTPSRAASSLTEGLRDALADYGRLAVPVFLVVAGFLAAQSLAPAGRCGAWTLGSAVMQRWKRLTPTYWAALALAVAACALARAWADIAALPEPPSAGQLVAHGLMLQDILALPALSAGLWYVAIDLQLFVVLAALLAMGRASPWPHSGPWLVLGLSVASWLAFNLDPSADAWAPYFFGAYGLGALAAWRQAGLRNLGGTLTMLGLGVLALAVAFRARIAVATLTALLLALATHRPARIPAFVTRLITALSRIAYAVFLTHFAVAMLCFAAAERYAPALALEWVLLATWTISLAVGAAVHRWIEAPRPRVQPSTEPPAGPLRRARPLTALSSPPGRTTHCVHAPLAAPPTRSL